MARTSKEPVICVKNEGYPASLELRKLYVAVPDAKAAAPGHLRIIDESVSVSARILCRSLIAAARSAACTASGLTPR